MASNNRASTATSRTETSESASTPLTVCVLSYNAEDWSNGVTLLDGSEPRRHCGILGAYRSVSEAQGVGIEWALKQFQDRHDRYSPPLATEERDAAFDDWPKYESEQRGVWSYTISKGNETLAVRAEEVIVYSPHVPRSNDDGEGEQEQEKGTNK